MPSHFGRVQLFVTLCSVACQAPRSMGFSKQEYWSGLPFPSPGDLPDPGTELASLTSPALAARFFTTSTTWKYICSFCHFVNCFGFVLLGLFSLPSSLLFSCDLMTNFIVVFVFLLCVSIADFQFVVTMRFWYSSLYKNKNILSYLSFSFQVHFQYPALSSSHNC